MHNDRVRVIFRCAAAVLGVTVALSGCAVGPAADPPVVTVTDTAWQQAPPDGSPPSADAAPVGSSARGEGGGNDGPEAHLAAPPTDQTSKAQRPMTQRPMTQPKTEPAKPQPSKTGPSKTGSTTQHSKRSGRTPPGSLSTDGNLIAAATSAAAIAGVAPADPDTPGPATGPKCRADSQYVNEAPTGLRSDVITAWHRTVAAAAERGVTLCLNDGKRSRAQQQAQFDQYVEQYGEKVAEELVLPPEKSAHVVGIALDVQPADGYRWLQATKGAYGFCRIYDNEPWHFEFNPAYRHTGCPARLPEPER